MNHKLARQGRQRGVSMLGVLFVAVVVGALALLAIQLIPVGLEYMSVKKAAKAGTTGRSVAEVRELFDKSIQTDQASQLSSRDIQVTREGDRVLVTFAYDRTVHLFGPAYLLVKVSGDSK